MECDQSTTERWRGPAALGRVAVGFVAMMVGLTQAVKRRDSSTLDIGPVSLTRPSGWLTRPLEPILSRSDTMIICGLVPDLTLYISLVVAIAQTQIVVASPNAR
jgi:hypothetical protein